MLICHVSQVIIVGGFEVLVSKLRDRNSLSWIACTKVQSASNFQSKLLCMDFYSSMGVLGPFRKQWQTTEQIRCAWSDIPGFILNCLFSLSLLVMLLSWRHVHFLFCVHRTWLHCQFCLRDEAFEDTIRNIQQFNHN